MQFLIVTGLSGAGKTSVLHHLEDSGFQCMDNLPPKLLGEVIRLFENVEAAPPVALGIDSRSRKLFDASAVLDAVEEGRRAHEISILFLTASPEALIDRYKETRRDHPLMHLGLSLEEAIARERELLQPLRERANLVLNSSGLGTRELCQRVDELIAAGAGPRMRVEICSFGYKRGIPRESDLVFDVRFLPHPYYIKELRAYTGLETPVSSFVLGSEETRRFLSHLFAMLRDLIPLYQKEGKRRLMIAIGCTGGAHRSVAIAEALLAHLKAEGIPASIRHRDLLIEEASWPFRRNRAAGGGQA